MRGVGWVELRERDEPSSTCTLTYGNGSHSILDYLERSPDCLMASTAGSVKYSGFANGYIREFIEG